MSKIYDLRKLIELCNNDDELFEESIKFFYNETIYNLSQILIKVKNFEYADVKAIAHRMKVNFVIIGSNGCVELCKKIKNEENNDDIEPLVNKLNMEYFKIYQQLKIEFPEVLNYEDVGLFKKSR